MNPLQAVEVSAKLLEARDACKLLLGHKWPARVEEYSAAIRELMRKARTESVLDAVLPVAKAMSAAGDSPMVLLAVACEMIAPEQEAKT